MPSSRIAPGLILDISSCLPVVLALMAGTAQTMSIDPQVEELDITLPDIEESVPLTLVVQSVASKSKRRKDLGNFSTKQTRICFKYNSSKRTAFENSHRMSTTSFFNLRD